MRRIASVVKLAKIILEKYVFEGMTVVDATAGNGHDSAYFKEVIGPEGHLYCFDVQETALAATANRLEEAGLNHNVTLVHDGHENLKDHVAQPVDMVMYNLGYLPKHDKTKTTLPHTTLESVNQAMDLIKVRGAVCIVAYPGHPEGAEEKAVLDQFVRTIDQKKFDVLKSEFINQINNPPVLYIIEKR